MRELTPYPSKVCTTYAGVNESAKKLILAQSIAILFSPFVLFFLFSNLIWHRNKIQERIDILIFPVFGIGVINLVIVGPLTVVATPLFVLYALTMMILTLIQRFKCC